jgi:chaperonin GroEL
MSKIVVMGKEAQEAILRGVDFLANPVKVTEGPRGRNVLMGQRAMGQSPRVSRDGVSVSNYIDPADPIEQIGADLIREAAQKTDNAVGDGTTAAITIAQAMIHEGFKLIAGGANPMALERGIRKSVDAVLEYVRKKATEVGPEDVFRVATVSAHGDEVVGRLVADAVKLAGKDGIVTAEPSSTSDTFVQSVAGLELDKSNLISQAFITSPERMVAELPDCRILLWEGVIFTAKSLVPLLQQIHKDSTPVLICAGGYEQEALACIINNKLKLALPLIAIRLEAYGERRKELMLDIAAMVGGKVFTEDLGTKLDTVKLSDLGVARKVTTDMRKTQIIEGKGNQAELKGRVESIRAAIETATGAEKVALRNRLAALLGGITVIKVGGVTVTEMEEKKDRVVDAMSAAKAALESGIVAGGGTALLRAIPAIYANKLQADEVPGASVVKAGCQAVARQIAENAGISGAQMIDQLMAVDVLGFNAFSGNFEDLVKSGIIDPAKVICESLRNAAAVSCSILTMGAVIGEVLEKPNV